MAHTTPVPAPSARLLLLPGLGADAGLFADLARRGIAFATPRWHGPRRGDDLRGWARRWADELRGAAGGDGPLVLGGMSFGGQVALELARHLRPAAVALISIHPCSDELTPRFRRQVRALPLLPDAALRWGMQRLAMPAIARRERLADEQRERLLAMARAADLGFFRWASRAAARWRWRRDPRDEGVDCPVLRVHGARDPIIPLGRRDADTTVLADAGHLLPMTHSDEVAAWLRLVLRRAAG